MDRPIIRAARRYVIALVLVVLGGWALAADTKDPLNYSIKQYLFILGLSVLGGMVAWWGKVRKGHLRASNLAALVGELSTSALAGLLAFYLCEYLNVAPVLTAAIVGVSGHMGAKALSWGEEALQRRAEKLIGHREHK